MAKNNPHKVNQYTAPDPRQSLFLSYYIDPKSATFSNAYQSAVKAGYEEEYAKVILNKDSLIISGINLKKFSIKKPHFFCHGRKGWIYAIKVGDYLKIGSSQNSIKSRIYDYTKVPPFEAEIILLKQVEDYKFFERYFQLMFVEYQVKGEWFFIGDVIKYKDYVNDNFDLLMKRFKDAIS